MMGLFSRRSSAEKAQQRELQKLQTAVSRAGALGAEGAAGVEEALAATSAASLRGLSPSAAVCASGAAAAGISALGFACESLEKAKAVVVVLFQRRLLDPRQPVGNKLLALLLLEHIFQSSSFARCVFVALAVGVNSPASGKGRGGVLRALSSAPCVSPLQWLVHLAPLQLLANSQQRVSRPSKAQLELLRSSQQFIRAVFPANASRPEIACCGSLAARCVFTAAAASVADSASVKSCLSRALQRLSGAEIRDCPQLPLDTLRALSGPAVDGLVSLAKQTELQEVEHFGRQRSERSQANERQNPPPSSADLSRRLTDATSATELLQELLRQQPTAEGMALMTPCSVELEQQLDELRKEAERLVDEGNIAEFDKVSKVVESASTTLERFQTLKTQVECGHTVLQPLPRPEEGAAYSVSAETSASDHTTRASPETASASASALAVQRRQLGADPQTAPPSEGGPFAQSPQQQEQQSRRPSEEASRKASSQDSAEARPAPDSAQGLFANSAKSLSDANAPSPSQLRGGWAGSRGTRRETSPSGSASSSKAAKSGGARNSSRSRSKGAAKRRRGEGAAEGLTKSNVSISLEGADWFSDAPLFAGGGAEKFASEAEGLPRAESAPLPSEGAMASLASLATTCPAGGAFALDEGQATEEALALNPEASLSFPYALAKTSSSPPASEAERTANTQGWAAEAGESFEQSGRRKASTSSASEPQPPAKTEAKSLAFEDFACFSSLSDSSTNSPLLAPCPAPSAPQPSQPSGETLEWGFGGLVQNAPLWQSPADAQAQQPLESSSLKTFQELKRETHQGDESVPTQGPRGDVPSLAETGGFGGAAAVGVGVGVGVGSHAQKAAAPSPAEPRLEKVRSSAARPVLSSSSSALFQNPGCSSDAGRLEGASVERSRLRLSAQRVSFRDGAASLGVGWGGGFVGSWNSQGEDATRSLAAAAPSAGLASAEASSSREQQALALQERVTSLQSQLTSLQRESAEREGRLRATENERDRLRAQLSGELEKKQALEEEISALTAAHRTALAASAKFEEELRNAQQATASAREMWLKESARASKLADELDIAERTIAVHEEAIVASKASEQSLRHELQALRRLLGDKAAAALRSAAPGEAERSLSASSCDALFGQPTGGPANTALVTRDCEAGGVVASSRVGAVLRQQRLEVEAFHIESTLAERDEAFVAPHVAACMKPANGFLKLLLCNSGVLYEDETLQIGVTSHFKESSGRLSLYFGNKRSSVLQQFSCELSLPRNDALVVELEEGQRPLQQLQGREQRAHFSAPLRVETRGIVRFVACAALGSALLRALRFLPDYQGLFPVRAPTICRAGGGTWPSRRFDTPKRKRSFAGVSASSMPDTSPWECSLPLPLTLSKFMRGEQLSPERFSNLWEAEAFALGETSCMLTLHPLLSGSMLALAKKLQLGGALCLCAALGDDSPETLSLAGSLPPPLSPPEEQLRQLLRPQQRGQHQHGGGLSQAGETGPPKSRIAVLVRVQVEGRQQGQCRLIVRSSDGISSKTIRSEIYAQIAAVPVAS